MTNIQEAKTHLSRLVERAHGGEEIIIAKAGKAMARLVPLEEKRKARTGGYFKPEEVNEAPDCWDPDPDLEALMLNGPIEPN